MRIYTWKKVVNLDALTETGTLHAKLVFKTEEASWVGSKNSVVIPISIHSKFHEGAVGELKMNAFISTIKENVRGKITILLTEGAHIQWLSLQHGNDFRKALDSATRDAKILAARFKSLFGSCDVVFWQTYISSDPYYHACRAYLSELYQKDLEFQKMLCQDAKMLYSISHQQECLDKICFIEKIKEDIFEHCVCVYVLIKKGYRFLFYPGAQFNSMYYINRIIGQQLTFIDVFLSVERKSYR